MHYYKPKPGDENKPVYERRYWPVYRDSKSTDGERITNNPGKLKMRTATVSASKVKGTPTFHLDADGCIPESVRCWMGYEKDIIDEQDVHPDPGHLDRWNEAGSKKLMVLDDDRSSVPSTQ